MKFVLYTIIINLILKLWLDKITLLLKLKQTGQIAASGRQIRLPDAAVLPTMLYGSKLLNLDLQPDFTRKLTLIV